MRRYLPIVALLLLSAAAFNSGGVALFTDTQDVSANTFTTATVDISTSPTSALVTYSAMVPGDTVTSAIVVSNAGTAALRYAITGSATDTDSKTLKDQLVLTIKEDDAADPGVCTAFDGTQLYTGDLDGASGVIEGSTAAGADSGDRALSASSNETLCFRVNLPTATGNAFQDATTTATFTFTAEQTANN